MILVYIELGNSLGMNYNPGSRNKHFGEKPQWEQLAWSPSRAGWTAGFYRAARQIAIGCWGEKGSSILLWNRLIRREYKLPPRVSMTWPLSRGASSELQLDGREGPLRCGGRSSTCWTEPPCLFSKSPQSMSRKLILFGTWDLSVSAGLGSGSLHLIKSAIRYSRVTKKKN